MNHDPGLPDLETFDWRAFLRAVTIQGIEGVADDPAEMKDRILLARECGILSDDQTSEMIRANGLEGA